MSTASHRDDTPHDVPVAGVSVLEWRRYGHHRAYAVLPDGTKLGFRCLATGLDHPVDPSYAAPLRSAVDTWSTREGQAEAVTPAAPAVVIRAPAAERRTPRPEAPWTDLARNVPGVRAREQAGALRQAAPARSVAGRLLGVRTEERVLRTGARSEQQVAAEIDTVRRADARWQVLHGVPVGRGESDIDHVVIGPGGVFTLRTVHHAAKRMWVGGDTVMVNGHRVPHVRAARHEARRASRLLSVAVGAEVEVVGVVVAVRLLELIVQTPPDDVVVLPRNALTRWLRERPTVLAVEEIGAIHAQARRSTTWCR